MNPNLKQGCYSIRKATNSDARAVWALITDVLLSYGISTNARTTDNDLTDIEGNYWKSGGAFFVLLDGEKVVGTVALARESDSACELCRMYLAPEYRGQGLGRRLLDHSLREAEVREFQEMHLKTASVLVEAISLYRRTGFVPVEGAKAGGNCDLVMTKVMPGPRPPTTPS
jgi:putative acetyltransferase